MPLPFYPFFWADYSSKTFNLTQGQHGAYMLFLRHEYSTGKTIPHEQRYSIAKAMLEQERENADFVLSQFYEKQGDCWTNPKVKEVMDDALAKHQRRVNAGKSPKKQFSNNAQAKPEQPQSEPEPESNKDSRSKRRVEDTGFDEFWQAYPRKVAKGSAKKAWKKALTKTSAETITAAARVFAGKQAGQDETFVPHAATWLNAERWQDKELAAAPQSGSGGYFAEEDSEEWKAWAEYRRKAKFPALRGLNLRNPRTGQMATGAYFRTQWPPKLPGDT